jgi:hypothetical protein
VEWVDGFILKRVLFLFEHINLKIYKIQQIISASVKKDI